MFTSVIRKPGERPQCCRRQEERVAGITPVPSSKQSSPETDCRPLPFLKRAEVQTWDLKPGTMAATVKSCARALRPVPAASAFGLSLDSGQWTTSLILCRQQNKTPGSGEQEGEKSLLALGLSPGPATKSPEAHTAGHCSHGASKTALA